jgi:hypothetical protein
LPARAFATTLAPSEGDGWGHLGPAGYAIDERCPRTPRIKTASMTPKEDRIMATTTKAPPPATIRKRTPLEYHHRAAAHHPAAAHHHLEAAHHHESGEDQPAGKHSEAATRHSERAGQHTAEAHLHSSR